MQIKGIKKLQKPKNKMSQNYTKAQYLATVETKEHYCTLLKNAIKQITAELGVLGDAPLLMLQKFELEAKLKMNTEIAEDSRKHYENTFLPNYEKRLEECYKNFDEYYEFIKANIEQIPKLNSLYVTIVGYEKENPDNKDEDKMLLFYEAIKPVVVMMKSAKK